ncbi:hypothetical protein EI94DRAFT_1708413 [Lactarius quietus]|nr:hypothetical protein EI94DRAFT_1708413 [Lactarius quietus]
MSKVLSPVGDDPPSVPATVPARTVTMVDTSRPLASMSMAAPLAVSSSQTLELLSAEVMLGVLKEGATHRWHGRVPGEHPSISTHRSTASQRGGGASSCDIGPLEVSDTEDDNSDDDDIQALDILVATTAAAITASNAGGAPIITPAAGPPGSCLEAIEHDLEQVPPHLVGWLRKARFGLMEMMRELAEVRQVVNNQNDRLLRIELVIDNIQRRILQWP